MSKKVFAVLGGVVFLSLLWALPIVAQRQIDAPAAPLAPDATPAQITFTLGSGTTAWLDNNKSCAPDYVGPHAMWIVVGITNNSTEPLTNAVATLSGFASANFTITADPIRYIGILAPSSTYYGYWYVSYACTSGQTDSYTVTVTADNLDGNAYYAGSLTTATTIDTANEAQVVSSLTKGTELAVGQVHTQAVRYQLANNNTSALFQPTGDSGFEDACFRLIAARVANSTSSGIGTGTMHQLFFTGGVNSGQIDMIYDWQALCYAESTSTPWAVVQSPAKYSNNYGVRFSTFPTANLSLDISVSVAPVLVLNADTVTYTVRLNNRFAEPLVVSGLDFHLPPSVVYKGMTAASGIRNDNSSRYPPLDATGLLDWEGLPALSYRVPASGTVTAGVPGVLELIFTAAPPTVNGRYTGIVSATVGIVDVGPMTVTFDVELPTAITLAAFEAAPQDDGILVTWETAMELDNVGFNLYRSTAAAGPYTQLNAGLIPPQFPGEVMGGTYEWRDTGVQSGVIYYYKLEDLDVKGVSTFHGPISTALVTSPTAVKLQRVSAHPATTPLALGLTMGLGLAGVCLPRRFRSRSYGTRIYPDQHRQS